MVNRENIVAQIRIHLPNALSACRCSGYDGRPMDLFDTPTSETVLSVSDLNREARYLLEGNFPAILVEGEISNIATPASGHWYLTLKDNNAQVRCAMFRNRNMRVRFRPTDGMQVLVKGKVSLYEGRGDFQMILENMEERGDGALLRAFEALKEKLYREGLFDDDLKRPLPRLPRHIGVITSPTGAAIRDIVSTLRRRFPAIAVTVIPVTVQGESAARETIAAIELANRREGCLEDLDVLVIGRGGGSLEDLWSYNDENLARCIRASELPVVSAVGHEVDFTIADFVADARAATPTAAAEILSPDQQEYRQWFAGYLRQFSGLARDLLARRRQSLQFLTRQLKHPGRKLQEQAQRLDDFEQRLRRAMRSRLHRMQSDVRHLHQGIRANSPLRVVSAYGQRQQALSHRLHKAMTHVLQQSKARLGGSSHALNTVSPLNTLARGYSITQTPDGQVLRSYQSIKPGDTIRSRLFDGELVSTVEKSSALETSGTAETEVGEAGNNPAPPTQEK